MWGFHPVVLLPTRAPRLVAAGEDAWWQEGASTGPAVRVLGGDVRGGRRGARWQVSLSLVGDGNG